MKSQKSLVENIPTSGLGFNAVVVLVVINCLLLVFQISSSGSLYERAWWPTEAQPMPCANITIAMDENLDMSSIDLSRGEVRSFRAHGIATRLIVEVGSYRNGPRTFSSVVLTSKRLNNLHDILYECEWATADSPTLKVKARAIKPDWNMGELYGTMVIVCTFPKDVGTKSEGGRLILTAHYPGAFRTPERFIALTEMQGEYNASRFQPPYPYDMTFCGSPLYGNISPQRIREWIAYHAYFLGNRTLFIFQDAGGIHDDVYRVLKPWIDLGQVLVENLRQAEVYEGYYHHQFTMLNDCLLRSQTLSNWTFFFDVDEFLFSSGDKKPVDLLAENARNNVTQFLFKTVKMSDGLCLKENKRESDSHFMAKISRSVSQTRGIAAFLELFFFLFSFDILFHLGAIVPVELRSSCTY